MSFRGRSPHGFAIGKRKLDDVIQVATVLDCYNDSHP
jgi:hypothetical protein